MIIVPHKGSKSSSVVGVLTSHSQEVVIYEETVLDKVHNTYQGYVVTVQTGKLNKLPEGKAVNIYDFGFNLILEPQQYVGYIVTTPTGAKVDSGSKSVSVYGNEYCGYLWSDAKHEGRALGHILGKIIKAVSIKHTGVFNEPVIKELFTRAPELREGDVFIHENLPGGELVARESVPVEYVPAPYQLEHRKNLTGRYPGSDCDTEYQERLKKFRPRRYPDTHIPIKRRVIIE